MENYRAIEIKDCCNSDISYGIIMLNNKHSVKEFQNTIWEIKRKYKQLDWQVNDILEDELLNKFDWFELPSDSEDYIEI